MTDPFSFVSASPRHALPLLFTGQAQKEFTVNEALSRMDALFHCAIEGEAVDPPPSPAEGECWLVATPASGTWAGHEGSVAGFQAGAWLFLPPRDGMRALDRSTGQELFFRGGWQVATVPASPVGGPVIDVEARDAIDGLINALRTAGVFPAS